MRIVSTFYAELIQVDKQKSLNLQKTPTATEKKLPEQKWREVIKNDLFYNPNLSWENNFFTVDS